MSEPDSRDDFTGLLDRWQRGDAAAGESALAIVYAELRRIAAAYLHGADSPTLQPTALVNEALMKLVGDVMPSWDSRAHFFGSAARAMRQILVDYARRRNADKRGGGVAAVELDAVLQHASASGFDLLALDDVLRRFEALDPQAARVVELRYFVGLSIDETAHALDLHPSAVNREWAMARAWLKRELGP